MRKPSSGVTGARPEADGPPLAIISDIHANLPALEAVLADIDRRGIERIVCLGDIVGYGPDPAACWRLVTARCQILIRGNHDHALGRREMARFHPRARAAVEWTLGKILAEADGEAIVHNLSTLPTFLEEGDRLYVHGSPAGPTMDYLLPGNAFDRERMQREFARVRQFAFNGHSHIPGVIARGAGFVPPELLDGARYKLGGRQAIINVGSVGQPRDGNPDACYVTVVAGRVHYHRIRYDAEAVCRRIVAIPELDPYLGQRLLNGQ